MRVITSLCGVNGENPPKIIAVSPELETWFVNADDLTEEYKEIVREIEATGKLTVLGLLFGPDEAGK